MWTIGAGLLLMRFVHPGLAAAVGVGAYVLGWVIIGRHADVTRRGTTHLFAVDFGDRRTPDEADRCADLCRAAEMLNAADRSLQAGEISAVAHEVIWARVFGEVDAAIGQGSRTSS